MVSKILLLFLVIFGEAKELSFLNSKEIKWLNSLKEPITIGITQIPNQVLLTQKGYEGFCIDLFDILEKKLHIKFKYIYFDTWTKLLSAAKKKKVDIIFLAQKTPSRLKYFYFTDTVLIQQNKIIVNINNDKYKNIEQLKFKKVAVTKGSAIEEYLSYNYPNLALILTANELESLKLLNEQKVDATILESVRASYYIKKYNLNNLIISNNVGYNYYLSIASRNDKPTLNIVLSKAIVNFEKEIKALKLKWGYVKDKVTFFDKKTLFFIAILFFLIISFLIYFYLINKKLKKEIKEKNEALKRLKILRDSKLNQMSEIISMIAHQWRQPLNNLSLINQIIVMKFEENKLDKEIMDYFKFHSQQQINFLTQTIDDFKNFFKIDEKQQKIDVVEVIISSIDLLKPNLKQNNIKINCDFSNEKIYSFGYKNGLKQVILNILNNAKDILIPLDTNKEINIYINKEETTIKIIIEDNGGGISIDIIDKIFNPYFSTKKEKNGTGLGLYMAKIIIEEKMNGKIEVKNTKNGANFEIRLPLFKG